MNFKAADSLNTFWYIVHRDESCITSRLNHPNNPSYQEFLEKAGDRVKFAPDYETWNLAIQIYQPAMQQSKRDLITKL